MQPRICGALPFDGREARRAAFCKSGTETTTRGTNVTKAFAARASRPAKSVALAAEPQAATLMARKPLESPTPAMSPVQGKRDEPIRKGEL
jgi:hypothetical protein